jgi:biofilm PGA synthesis N-glycosyltransferase PgaC
MEFLNLLLWVVSVPTFLTGLVTLIYYPLSLWYETRTPKAPVFNYGMPLVTVIVPAYNEGKVIANCVDSILRDHYPRKEIILVDDGSSDDTLAVMQRYAHMPHVTVIGKANGGKASALNAGIQVAAGEILFFVDADGIFMSTTITEMLKGFDDAKVGAVCGNDEPVNVDRPQTHLAALLTHVGTGFVRRALAMINCLPIVSGNLGAFRRSVIDQIGGFRHGFIGEDLELTWRVHKAGYRVNFQPRARVYAEVPSTLQGLWKQRVRWARGLLQTSWLHKDMFFNPYYGRFGMFLPLNVTGMVMIPLLQLSAFGIMVVLALLGATDWLNLVLVMSFIVALATAAYAIALDQAWGDLKYLYAVPFWFPYSLMMNCVMLWALFLELQGQEARWNKLERTGAVTRGIG